MQQAQTTFVACQRWFPCMYGLKYTRWTRSGHQFGTFHFLLDLRREEGNILCRGYISLYSLLRTNKIYSIHVEPVLVGFAVNGPPVTGQLIQVSIPIVFQSLRNPNITILPHNYYVTGDCCITHMFIYYFYITILPHYYYITPILLYFPYIPTLPY